MGGVPPWLTILGLLVSVLTSAGVGSVLTARATARRTYSEARKAEHEAGRADAEARRWVSEASRELIQPLVTRAQHLEAELRATEQELLEARRLTKQLTGSLRAAQAETVELRVQVDQMSRDMATLHTENERLRAAHRGDGDAAGLQS